MVHIFPTSRNERALRNCSPNGKHPWSSLVSSRIAVTTTKFVICQTILRQPFQEVERGRHVCSL